MNKYAHRLADLARAEAPKAIKEAKGWENIPPRALSRCLVKLVWRREERVRKCPSGTRYLAADYEESRLTRTKTGGYPQLSIGIALIIKCRLGGF